MKKWLFILFMLTIMVLVYNRTRKEKGGGREILRRLNAAITWLAWFLLVIYGLAFVYWVIKTILQGG